MPGAGANRARVESDTCAPYRRPASESRLCVSSTSRAISRCVIAVLTETRGDSIRHRGGP
eukprot:8309736-Pyramimonas_sp.AAC.1